MLIGGCVVALLVTSGTFMALFLAVGIGLVAWPLVSYSYPTLFSQIPLDIFRYARPDRDNPSVITPQLSTFIENTMVLENITGLSVAVIPRYGNPEFHTWGYRTEDEDKVTPDVCNLLPVFISIRCTVDTLFADALLLGVSVESILQHGARSPH